MKTKRTQGIRRVLLAGFATTLLSSAASLVHAADAPIVLRTDGLPPWVAAKLTEKSRQGIVPVMQYLQRTRMIHGLYIGDLLLPEARRSLAAQPESAKLAKLGGR
jgi:hypothetical protein